MLCTRERGCVLCCFDLLCSTRRCVSLLGRGRLHSAARLLLLMTACGSRASPLVALAFVACLNPVSDYVWAAVHRSSIWCTRPMIHNLFCAAICGATLPSLQVAVILSRQHSGTSFLSSVLQGIPDTVMGGELFLNKGPCYLWLNGTHRSLALEAIRGQRVIHGPPDAISNCLGVSQVASGTDAQRLLLRSKRVGFTWQANRANSPLGQCFFIRNGNASTPNGSANHCNSTNVKFLRAAKVLLLRRDNPLAFRMAASNRKEVYSKHRLTPPNVSQGVTFTSRENNFLL